MAVDTEQAHWECRKCKNVFDNSGYRSAKDDRCPSGGRHDFKHVAQSWDNSLLGASVNLLGRGLKAGAKASSKAASNYANREVSEDEKEQRELRRQQAKEEAKIKNQELANKTIKNFNIIKPYLKFIIPLYIAGFIITYFIVDKKDKQLVLLLGCLPIGIVIFLAYNAFINKPKS